MLLIHDKEFLEIYTLMKNYKQCNIEIDITVLCLGLQSANMSHSKQKKTVL